MATLLEDSQLETLRRIVDGAVCAPSAENTQPWQFIADGNELTVCLDTKRTLASDIGNMLSLTAIGAAIENAVIAATKWRLRGEFEFVYEPSNDAPDTPNPPIARIRFVEGATFDPLAEHIELRCTARRMDHRRQVDQSLLRQIRKSCDDHREVSVHWVDAPRLREFANLVGTGNRIRFEFQPFHQELYDNLRFTQPDVAQSRDGLDVATLQLPPGVKTILSALRNWRRMKCANVIGFSRSVARQAAQEVCRSGAVGFITVPSPAAKYFVDGGRAMERMWLAATRLGLCFHPTASLPVFLAHVRAGGQRLIPRHLQLATHMSERFYRLFPEVTGQALQMAFRIGYGPAPPVRSLRRPVGAVLDLM